MASLLRRSWMIAVFALALLAAGLMAYSQIGTQQATAQSSSKEALIVAAGDIGNARGGGAPATGKSVKAILNSQSAVPEHVLTLGDNAYDKGTTSDFCDDYDPFWGSFAGKTLPTVGNHDIKSHGQSNYGFADYYNGNISCNSAHGDQPGTWDDGNPDSYNYIEQVGSNWKIISANSNSSADAPACGTTRDFIRDALDAAQGFRHTIVAFHHPQWSDGLDHQSGEDCAGSQMAGILDTKGADLVLNGHTHNYQRFSDKEGVKDFVVVGGGGAPLKCFDKTKTGGRDKAYCKGHGVLKINLYSNKYTGKFVKSNHKANSFKDQFASTPD